MVFNNHHYTHISIALNHTKDPVAFMVMAAVILPVHKLTFLYLNCPIWLIYHHWIIQQVLAVYITKFCQLIIAFVGIPVSTQVSDSLICHNRQ